MLSKSYVKLGVNAPKMLWRTIPTTWLSDIFAIDKLRSLNHIILHIGVQKAHRYKLQTVFLDNWHFVVLQEIVKEHDTYRGS